jgi:hypothetical protein
MVFFAIGEALRQQYKRQGADLDEDLRQFSRPDWLDRAEPEKPRLKVYTGLACRALADAYKDAKNAQAFTHRNWFRSKDTLDLVRYAVGRLIDIMSIVPGHAIPLLRER